MALNLVKAGLPQEGLTLVGSVYALRRQPGRQQDAVPLQQLAVNQKRFGAERGEGHSASRLQDAPPLAQGGLYVRKRVECRGADDRVEAPGGQRQSRPVALS